MTVRKLHHPYGNKVSTSIKIICPSNVCAYMQDSQTKLHRMHTMILIREHQQQHYAGDDESAVQ